MFKSKTSFEAFDKNNTKVPNVEFSKLKALSKTQLKKLLGALKERTVFHLLLHYFLDKNGKSLAHFFDLGEHKKLSKHFEQVEMKPGKPNKRVSNSPKEACLGSVYIDRIEGAPVVHLEPHPKSKIPVGKWPKILKELKPMLAGMKAVVVLEGQVVQEGTEEEQPQTETTPNTEAVDPLLKQQWNGILEALKNQLPNEIVPRIKKQQATVDDLTTIQTLLSDVVRFQNKLRDSSTSVQQKFAKPLQLLEAQFPKIQAIQQRLEQLLANTTTDGSEQDRNPNDQALAEQLQQLIEQADAGLEAFETLYQSYLDQPIQEPEPLVGGTDFLKAIG